jgi:cryptochrome
LDRYADAAVAAGEVDPPSGPACGGMFLTRGGCYVHWERGAEVFEEWLVDHETACNVGNWMWLSCTAFFSMFYRVCSLVAFGRKTDAEGKFVKHFVPELEHYDHKYIYEP